MDDALADVVALIQSRDEMAREIAVETMANPGVARIRESLLAVLTLGAALRDARRYLKTVQASEANCKRTGDVMLPARRRSQQPPGFGS